MSRTPKNFGSAIPELRETIMRYGCRLSEKPQFVIVGQYNSREIGPIMGILAAANNEFHAHILRREFRKNGNCDIEITEYYPDPSKQTFSIEIYKEKFRENMERKQKEAE